MKRSCIFLVLFLVFGFQSAFAHDGGARGHKIRVKLDNYAEKQLVLGFYLGEKPYVKDTADLGADGYFHFDADTLLPCGVYLLVTKPDNNFIQFLLPENDQDFTLTTDVKAAVEKMSVEGSEDNANFYQYMQLLARLRPEAASPARSPISTSKSRNSSTT